MKRIFIVHRWEGEIDTDWYPWLKTELEKSGHQVFILKMPNSSVPTIENWVTYIAEKVGEPDSDTYFIGHSIGCQAILRYLDSCDFDSGAHVGGAVFVSGWFKLENLEDEETKEVAKPWMEEPIDLDKVKAVLPRSTLIISDNDPYGAFELNKKKFKEIGSKIIVLHNAGHITAYNGYSKLPEALSELNKF